jgi:hypothetical protein
MKKQLYKDYCKELDDLSYRLMRAREFAPHKVPYYEDLIKEHKLVCTGCSRHK